MFNSVWENKRIKILSNDKGEIGFNIEPLKNGELSYFKFAAYNMAYRNNLFKNKKCRTHKYYKIQIQFLRDKNI
mgnify:CR=1 FL=1